jgi:ATP-dependent DNA helicase RecQ
MPILATTATANDRVVNDIVAQLGSALMVLRGPLARRSLRLQNIYLPSQAARLAWLAERLPELPGTGIVYVLTKADAERVAAWLQSCGINAMPYHSKTGDGEGDDTAREELEALLRNNEVKALVATVALGMGFDKPDIGFVIHFQRPGSAVHYYQQVGRAGRALDLAYGILLSGVEDEEITEYFIRSSFPPEGHVDEVLKALGKSADGLSIFELQNHVNLNHMEIEKVLKLLSVESPSPVVKEGSKWKATYVAYKPDRERINQLTALRRHEQERMREYMKNTECLMTFLRRELSDPDTTPCGKCAVCVGKPLLPETFSDQVAVDAVQFLRRSERTIEPRKKWLGDGIVIHGWKPNTAISDTLRPQAGKALCFWGDAGWGDMVRRGKMEMGRFDDALVVALSEMILDRWKPSPMPTWVTCVPSLTRPMLVSDLARRLAGRLGLQFVECVLKIRNTLPQKAMNNSAQQAGNIAGAFEIKRWPGIGGPVLLVDDMVDSRWTFTVISALLRSEGSGPVFPTALAMVQFGQD